MRVVINGHYGGINLGDDAILCSLVEMLREICPEELALVVFSHNPELTQKQMDVKSIKQMTFSFSMLKELNNMTKAIRNADLVMIGGGGLLQDEFNIRTIPRYLLPAMIGKFFWKKIVFYALGVGPLNMRYSKNLITLISAQVSKVTVRDKESKKTMEQMGVKGVDVVPDPALSLPKCDNKRTLQILREENIDPNRVPKIGVSLRGLYHTSSRKLRSMKYLSTKQKEIFIDALEGVATQLGALLIFFCIDDYMDKNISEEIAGRCRCDTHLITSKYSPSELAGILGTMDVVVSMPLHSAIIASSNFVPVVAIDYNPKVRNFMRLVGLEEYILPIERLDLLETKILRVWNERSEINRHLVKKIGRIKEKSIKDLHRLIYNELKIPDSRNIPLLFLTLIYMALGFIPEYFIHACAKNKPH